jgi:hypothetical protein
MYIGFDSAHLGRITHAEHDSKLLPLPKSIAYLRSRGEVEVAELLRFQIKFYSVSRHITGKTELCLQKG